MVHTLVLLQPTNIVMDSLVNFFTKITLINKIQRDPKMYRGLMVTEVEIYDRQ